jgi:hypothetical protein
LLRLSGAVKHVAFPKFCRCCGESVTNNMLVVALAYLTVCIAAPATSPALSAKNILLPLLSHEKNASFPLSVTHGCYVWSSSDPNVAVVELAPSSASSSSREDGFTEVDGHAKSVTPAIRRTLFVLFLVAKAFESFHGISPAWSTVLLSLSLQSQPYGCVCVHVQVQWHGWRNLFGTLSTTHSPRCERGRPRLERQGVSAGDVTTSRYHYCI